MLTMLERLDPSTIRSVYSVTPKVRTADRPDRREYVIVLINFGYFCSCLLQQNTGVVCRHFFCLMEGEETCKYHISAVRTRWFKEEYQEDRDLDKTLSEVPFVVACCHSPSGNQKPNKTFMNEIRTMVSEESAIPRTSKAMHSKKQQYGKAMGLSRTVISAAEGDKEVYNDLLQSLDGVMQRRDVRLTKAYGLESLSDADADNERTKNPLVRPKPGRPSTARLKSITETRIAKKRKTKSMLDL